MKQMIVKYDNGEVYAIPYEFLVDLMTQEHRPPDDEEDLLDYLQNNTCWHELSTVAKLIQVDPNCAYDYEAEWPNVQPHFENVNRQPEHPMELINLTQHVITIHLADGTERKVEPSGTVARVEVEAVELPPLLLDDGTAIPVKKTSLKGVVGLPPEKPHTAYIVSLVVAKSVAGRYDVFSPGELVRDEHGQPAGCHGLAC